MIELRFKPLTPILIALFFSCGNVAKNSQDNIILSTNDSSVVKIKITYVNWLIVTSFSVSCDKFEQSFKKSIKERTFTKKATLDSIETFIKTTQLNNDTIKSIDTRFKMIIFKENQEDNDTICGNSQGVRINGKNYLIENKFSNYLKELTK